MQETEFIECTGTSHIGITDDTLDLRVVEDMIKWWEFAHKNYWTWNSQSDAGSLPTSLRDDEVIESTQSLYNQEFPPQIIDRYWEGLYRCLSQYCKRYDFNNVTLMHRNFKMHKVKPGQGYHIWHYENGQHQATDRILAFMTYLTAPEEGGETEFLHQSVRVKPKVGRTVIWPASFTHLHRGNPPLKGEKLYITGWFHVAPNKEMFVSTNELANAGKLEYITFENPTGGLNYTWQYDN